MTPFIRKNKLLFAVLIVTGLSIAAGYMYLTPSAYMSTAVIKVENSNGTSDLNAVAAEMISQPFVSDALKDKGLNVEYYIRSDFRTISANYASPYTVEFRETSKGFHSRKYKIKLIGDKSFSLRRIEYGQERILTGTIGEELEDRGISLLISLKDRRTSLSSIIEGPHYSFEIYSNEALAQNLCGINGTLKTNTTNGLITLSCLHKSSSTAKKIIESLTNNYALNNQVAYNISDTKSVSFIDQQIETVANQLEKSQNEIAEFKRQNNLLDISSNSETALNELSQLQMQKVELDIQMAALDNISLYLRKNRTLNNSMVDYGTITDPIFTENIKALGAKYREKETLARSSSDTQSIDNEIELLKESISESVLNTRKKTYIKKEEIMNAIARTKAAIRSFPAVETQLASLQRKVEMDQKLYDGLIERRAESIINTTVPANTLRVVTPANLPYEPYTPNIPQTTGIAFLISLFMATIIGLFRTSKTVSIKTRQELESETTIPFIGNIKKDKHSNSSSVESFSEICTRLLMRNETRDSQVITVTSTLAGEGKTYVATNLAKSLAAIDKKVLLIDMNIRKPELNKLFNITSQYTLADVLDSRINIHEAAGITSIPNLEVINGGEFKSGINSLLTSGKTSEVLNELKKHYNVIIIDTPETGTYIDAVPLMRMSDLSLYVVKASAKTDSQVINAELICKDYDIHNMHIVLNSVKTTHNHAGLSRTGTYKLPVYSEGHEIVGEQHGFLRKIALWFY